jgi:hypothetical protein
MPGKRITDLQVSKYKELRGKFSQEAAAAKTGISVASARRLESSIGLPFRETSVGPGGQDNHCLRQCGCIEMTR